MDRGEPVTEQTAGSRMVQRQLLTLAQSAHQQHESDPATLARLLTAEIGETDSTCLYTENKLELHHYEPETIEHETPLCIAYALVNRPDILDLQPDRSVIRQLLDAGFEVYLIRWGEPSQLDTALGLSDYVCRYMDNCIEAVCEHADVDAVHLLGYCMGGTMAIMYTTLCQRRIRTLSLMATPVAMDGNGGVLEQWANYLDPETITDTYENVPAELLAVTFALLNPVDNFLGKYVRFLENIDDEEFVANFARMERWTWDGVDVAGAVFREFLDEIYEQNNLVTGELSLNGKRVDPSEIEIPVVQIVGEYDHIIPPASSRPLNDVIASDDERIIEFGAGHIGISVSARAHETLWPTVCEWYAKRS